MGCTQSTIENNGQQMVEEKDLDSQEIDAIHSAIRWRKSNEEVGALLVSSKAVNCVDYRNGNTAMMIAAQNGHVDLVKLLIRKQANLNARNLKGNTALHMAIEYEYIECVDLLLDAGADKTIINQSGFPAIYGLEGKRVYGIIKLANATTKESYLNAFSICKNDYRFNAFSNDPNRISKAEFVAASLKAKKSLGEIWDDELKTTTKDMMDLLAD